MIRIASVPVERTCDRVFRNQYPNHVSHVRRLPGVNRDAIVDRRVRRHHDDFAVNYWSMTRLDARFCPTFDLRRMSMAEQATTIRQARACQTFDVIERMKVGLAWKAQPRAGVERFEWSASHFFN